jgi:hypothetical protein
VDAGNPRGVFRGKEGGEDLCERRKGIREQRAAEGEEICRHPRIIDDDDGNAGSEGVSGEPQPDAEGIGDCQGLAVGGEIEEGSCGIPGW